MTQVESIVTPEKIKKIETFIENGIKLLDNEKYIEFNNRNLEISKEAQEQMGDDEEKKAYLYSALTQFANKLMFYLFEKGLHTENIEREYRELDSMEVAGNNVQSFVDAREERRKELVESMNKLQEEQKAVNSFVEILEDRKPKEEPAKEA